MTYENIRITFPSFTIKEGTFLFFNHVNNILYQKNTKGSVIFTYPLDTVLGSEVLSTKCDGTNFWTIQQGSTSFDRVLKKWRIENYFCVLKDTISLNSATSIYNYAINSFVLEAFPTSLASPIVPGSSSISLNDFNTQVIPGTVITVGPNLDGLYEEVTVTGTLSNNTYGLDFYTKYNHTLDEPVTFVNNIWFFNNYNYKILQGSLYKFNLQDRSINKVLLDNNFSNIDASTFYRDGSNNYIIFVLGTVLKFFDISSLTIVKSMLLDNIKADNVTINSIREIEVEGDTLYRLQNNMTYYGVNTTQSTYNYQCSTLRSFVDSVTMDIYPKILPSDGMSTVLLSAVVQDQYSFPAQFKVVRFFDSDGELGFITIKEPLTNLSGLAKSYYRSGVVPQSVTITAFITQYD